MTKRYDDELDPNKPIAVIYLGIKGPSFDLDWRPIAEAYPPMLNDEEEEGEEAFFDKFAESLFNDELSPQQLLKWRLEDIYSQFGLDEEDQAVMVDEFVATLMKKASILPKGASITVVIKQNFQ